MILAMNPSSTPWSRQTRAAGMACAWIDCEALDEQGEGSSKSGHEINFNGVLFQYQLPRLLYAIDAGLTGVEKRILELLREVTE